MDGDEKNDRFNYNMVIDSLIQLINVVVKISHESKIFDVFIIVFLFRRPLNYTFKRPKTLSETLSESFGKRFNLASPSISKHCRGRIESFQ